VIYNHSIIGDNVIIHANTVIGADAFYYKNRGTHWEQLVSCGKVIIEDLIATAILYFEPRVNLIGVSVDDNGQMSGKINVSISYEVKGVNSRKNMVYPFYLAEGTDL
jgi:hypothetical protein